MKMQPASPALEKRFQALTRVVLEKQLKSGPEPQVLVYDRQCELAELLAEAYKANMPNAECINFDEIDPEELRLKLIALPKGATVILVQSTNFRITEFRFRLELFNRGLGCLEHTRLAYFKPEEYEIYADALEFRGDYYKAKGSEIAQKLEEATSIEIVSHGGSVLHFGPMEKAKINHGLFAEQEHRGGAAICGEVFSEAKDFSSVNGELMVRAYPGEDLLVVHCEPFKVRVVKGLLSCDDPNCPEDFRARVLDKIAASEGGEVLVREAGFGLNPAVSFVTSLSDVNHFERMAGFHLSLGKKHNIYREKISAKITQRYHVDVFADLKEIRVNGEAIFANGAYL